METRRLVHPEHYPRLTGEELRKHFLVDGRLKFPPYQSNSRFQCMLGAAIFICLLYSASHKPCPVYRKPSTVNRKPRTIIPPRFNRFSLRFG